MRIGDVGEFGLIDRIERIAREAGGRRVALGIGDDAALVRPRPGADLVVTTDALVENVHFRWNTQGARTVGARALAVNLSDLAAMGARPLGCLLALAAPPSLALRTALDLARGLVTWGRRVRCPLLGGNVSAARETSLTVTALGEVARGRALRRSGARPGHRLLVTGTVGGAALQVERARRGRGRVGRLPEPRLRAGQALTRIPHVGGCIDLSDGLLADLRHLLDASGVGADLDPGRLPVPRGFSAACRGLGLDPTRLALAGGEDYELLFTLGREGPAAPQLGRRLGVAVTEIGTITRRRGLRLRGLAGPAPRAGGWRHF